MANLPNLHKRLADFWSLGSYFALVRIVVLWFSVGVNLFLLFHRLIADHDFSVYGFVAPLVSVLFLLVVLVTEQIRFNIVARMHVGIHYAYAALLMLCGMGVIPSIETASYGSVSIVFLLPIVVFLLLNSMMSISVDN